MFFKAQRMFPNQRWRWNRRRSKRNNKIIRRFFILFVLYFRKNIFELLVLGAIFMKSIFEHLDLGAIYKLIIN